MSGDLEDMRTYSRGYEDGRRSKDADHAAVVLKLSRLRFNGGSHENLHKIAYAIYPCATGWTCESSKGLRDRLIDLLGGVHEHRCDSGRGCACGNSRAGGHGELAEAMTYEPDSQESPNLANSGGGDGSKVTITAEFREFVETAMRSNGHCISEEELLDIADRMDEQFGRVCEQREAVMKKAVIDLAEKRDKLQAKLEEADAAIANWRVRERSFDAAQAKLDAIREALDGRDTIC